MNHRALHVMPCTALLGLAGLLDPAHGAVRTAPHPSVGALQDTAPPAAPPLSQSPAEALDALAALVRERPAMLSMRDIATSPGGRPVTAWTLSADPKTADSRPGVLLVAGLDADRPAHVSIAAGAVRHLLDTHADLLSQVTVYVIPCANPDALYGGTARAEAAPSRNARSVDDDRDGTADEDSPRDLDGNGMITPMRRLNPPPGDAPTHAVDPAERRLVRAADPVAGARPEFSMHIEGTDADGDGRIGEDPAGGVDVDCNFPARWPEFASHAGAFQLSEPESAAIATFVLERPRMAGALCLGRWESLARTPDPKPRDSTGKTPMELDAGDEALWRELGKVWRDSSGQSRWTDADPSGCLALWLYAHRGLPAFSTQGWGRPDAPKAEGADGTGPEGAGASDGKAARGANGRSGAKAADEESVEWLAISDRAYGGSGFVPWAPYAHPTLGAVEIGGFVPGFRRNPPPDARQRIAEAAGDFVAMIAERRPQVRIDSVTVEELAPGIRRIRMRIANDGWLPTATAMGRVNEAPGAVVVRIDSPREAIKSGSRASRIASISGYGAEDLEWVVHQSPAAPVRIEARWRAMDPQAAVIEGTAVRLEGVPARAGAAASQGGAQ
ncbi:MAG: hypothetical protein FGM37_09150 [Phycisphaerales bacterium]|nr:hypothetical protein [Phycisphaerales bacterium]